MNSAGPSDATVRALQRVDAGGHGSDMYKAFAAGSVNSINTLTSLISQA